MARATTVTLDGDLVEEVLAATRETTKASAVRKALTEFLRMQRLRELADMAGRVELRYSNEEIEAMEQS